MLCALCVICHATYLIDNNKKICKELQDKKKALTTHKQSVRLLDDFPFKNGITVSLPELKSLRKKT